MLRGSLEPIVTDSFAHAVCMQLPRRLAVIWQCWHVSIGHGFAFMLLETCAMRVYACGCLYYTVESLGPWWALLIYVDASVGAVVPRHTEEVWGALAEI